MSAANAVLTLDQRLGLDHYETDHELDHIRVDADLCAACVARPCLTACPASVYRWVDGHMAVRYENCLECGTCQLVCDATGNRGLDWRNPQGGYGIVFRFG